jgi:hypothetical protein
MFFIAISLIRHIVFKKIWIDMKINFTTFFVTYSRWAYLSIFKKIEICMRFAKPKNLGLLAGRVLLGLSVLPLYLFCHHNLH